MVSSRKTTTRPDPAKAIFLELLFTDFTRGIIIYLEPSARQIPVEIVS
jgi:hypothetical protein